MSTNASPNGRSLLSTLAPVAAVSLILIGALILVLRSREPEPSVADVRRTIVDMILDAGPDGASIGTWHVAAAAGNRETGQLQDLRVECGPMLIGAPTARLTVDAGEDVFAFQLTDAVIVNVPKEGDGSARPVRIATFELGPIPYSTGIAPNENEAAPVIERGLVGVTDESP